MVMGDDSCSRGCGFEYRHRILEKEAGVGPFLSNNIIIKWKVKFLKIISEFQYAIVIDQLYDQSYIQVLL